MTTLFKRLLFASLIAFPSLVFAADNGTELKPTAPPQASVEAAPKPAATLQAARVGYVDIVRIGTESERGKALKALLTGKKDKIQGKVDAKKKQIEKLKSSIEGKLATMTPQQREAKSKEFQKKVEEFQKFARTSEEDLYNLQDSESSTFFEAIERAAVAYGKASGFSAIVVKKELLYIGSSVDAQDVTDALIKELDQSDRKK